MKKVFISLAITISIIGCISFAALAHAASNANVVSNTNNDTLIRELQQSKNFKDMGITLEKSNESVKIDEGTAIAKAKQYLKPNAPKNVRAAHVKFTMNRANKLPNDIVPKDVSSWVISFDGLSIATDGGKMLNNSSTEVHSFHKANVVIDANTGKQIMINFSE